MVVAAPKTPVTGFQAVEVIKSTNPNFPIASEDSLTSTMMMPMIKKMTVKDAIAVRERKISSGIFFGRDMANELTFLLYRKIENKTKTGQISAVEISDPYILICVITLTECRLLSSNPQFWI
jgi:PBP1b-binding outer membrane lipoprotein LpoB